MARRFGLVAAALCTVSATAADAPPGSLPGDEALTCDQLYAQGMAESQRDQQARAQRNAQMKAEGAATGALVAGAMATGGALAPAAQVAVETQADKSMAMLSGPQANPRMQRIKALWSGKQCAMPGAAAAPQSDDAMTCEQIAAELAPYAQQMVPNLQALGGTTQQLYAQGKTMEQQRKVENAMLSAMATPGAVDPTGASKRAYEMALLAQQAKERAENEAYANSPLAKENRAQMEQLAAQGKQMQSNDRLQHLLQLGQQRHCDKKSG
jgi:hypothetical protein